MKYPTPKQAAAFKAHVKSSLIAIGAHETDDHYGLRLDTIFGGLRLSAGENSIRTMFDVVPPTHPAGTHLNPHSGKWNFEFGVIPTQEELDYAIRSITRLLP